MFTPETSKHFEAWTDPDSGIVSYVLKTRVAPVQLGFYFVNSASDDALRYLWFYCFFPPAMYATLGVVDFETDEVHHFPETEYTAAPVVDPDTGDVFYANEKGFYRRSPKAGQTPQLICPLPKELSPYGKPSVIASHLTFTPDHSALFVDTRSGDHWIHGTVDLTDGHFETWHTYSYCKTHAQHNPVRPGLTLCAEDHWYDRLGRFFDMRINQKGQYQRLYLEMENGKTQLIPPLGNRFATHEFWNAAGNRFYYCRYDLLDRKDVAYYDIDTHEHKSAGPVPAWHCHTSREDRYIVFDENNRFYRGTASRVGIYDTVTDKRFFIVTQNPALAIKKKPFLYEMDPHPRFIAGDRYVNYTIAQNGYPQIALCPVEPLKQLFE